MSIQSEINKMITTTAGVAVGAKKLANEKAKEVANAEKQKQQEAEKTALEEQKAKEKELEKSKSLYQATKVEEQETSKAIKGLANLQAKYRKDFIHSQFDYEGLKSGNKSPLEFQAEYMNNLANMKLQGIPSFRSLVTSKGWDTRRKNLKEGKNNHVK